MRDCAGRPPLALPSATVDDPDRHAGSRV